MKLSDAVKIYAGSSEAEKIMLGSEEVWSGAPPYGDDFCTGGTASSQADPYQPPANGFDDNLSTYTQNHNEVPFWWKYDLGVGVAKAAAKYAITLSAFSPSYAPSAWKLWGSNIGTDGTDVDWVELDSRTGVNWSTAYEKKEWEIANRTTYRYYRWSFSDGLSGIICIAEFELMAIS